MQYSKFGKRLKQSLEQKGLDEASLAKKLNITRQSVYKWTSGKATPGFDTLVSIAKLLDVSLDFLMRGITYTNVPDTLGGSALVSFTSVKVWSKAYFDRDEAEMYLEGPVGNHYIQGAFPDNSFLFTMNKENMTGTNPSTSILKGDILWVDEDLPLAHGNIVFVITFQNSVEVCQVLFGNDDFTLKSLHPDYPDWHADFNAVYVMYPIRQVIRPPRILI